MKHIALMAVLALCAGSCIKFELSKTSHPDQGGLYLLTEWSKRTAGVAIPNSRVVDVGPVQAEFTGVPSEHALPLLPAGGYQLLVYTPADKISVQASVATVATNANGFLDPLPGWLFTHTQSVEVTKDAEQHLTAPMAQQVRPVKLSLHADNSDTTMLASVTAEIDGLASLLNMATGTLGSTPAKTSFSFVKPAVSTSETISRANAKVRYALANIRLMGIVSTEKQTITLKVTFKDGSSTLVKSDLTEKMAGFNVDKHITLELDAEIDVLKTEVGFTAKIGNWDAYKYEIVAD